MFRSFSSLVINKRHVFDVRNILIPSSHFCYKFRYYCDRREDDNEKPPMKNNPSNKNYTDETVQPGLESKYKLFHDEDAPIILDVYGEKMLEENLPEIPKEEFHGLSLERGVSGVFEIEDLVELLRREKAEDIFIVALPLEARYVDYIAIVSGRSRRHMIALAEITRRMFKKRRNPTDIIPRIEGESSSTWIAMDLGNIALHIFSHHAREYYDLETLWSVGTKYDSLSNKAEDPLVALLKKHSISLNDMTSKGQLL